MGIQKFLFAVVAVIMLASSAHAVDPPPIDSHLFQSGELIYTDGFDGPLNKKWWQTRTKNWEVVDGLLIGAPDYKDAEEAVGMEEEVVVPLAAQLASALLHLHACEIAHRDIKPGNVLFVDAERTQVNVGM